MEKEELSGGQVDDDHAHNKKICDLIARLGVKPCYIAPSDIELAQYYLRTLIK